MCGHDFGLLHMNLDFGRDRRESDVLRKCLQSSDSSQSKLSHLEVPGKRKRLSTHLEHLWIY